MATGTSNQGASFVYDKTGGKDTFDLRTALNSGSWFPVIPTEADGVIDRKFQAISAANLKASLGNALPLFKYRIVPVNQTETMDPRGWIDISDYKPNPPSNQYDFFMAGILSWGSTNTGDSIFWITTNGLYLMGKPGLVINSLQLYYVWCLKTDYVIWNVS